MFDPLWESVYRLERLGMRVLGVCCDGLAAIRRLFSLHCSGSNALIYKVLNPHANERRYLFFFSDPPHLLKTVRNCWANSKRNLWVYLINDYRLLVLSLLTCSNFIVQW